MQQALGGQGSLAGHLRCRRQPAHVNACLLRTQRVRQPLIVRAASSAAAPGSNDPYKVRLSSFITYVLQHEPSTLRLTCASALALRVGAVRRC